ncbi:thiol-disulfide oxidoreductase DCC family protein, partial [Chlamydiota bacterium]
MKHVIFYDGECPLCNRAVRFILSVDREEKFYFAPLNGKTAEQKLAHFFLKNPELDTLVLLQNYETAHEKLMIEGKGALRILWLLGGTYALLGLLSFLPSFLF